jgi:glycosyltransferase involved in cell wall biosynthesis
VPKPAKTVRVLEVVDTLEAGGMEHQLVHLINRLDPERFHFEVCCLRHAGVNADKLNHGVPVHTLRKAEGFQWSAVNGLRGILQKGFDVVHTHNLSPLIYAALATWGGITPIFHGEHAQLTPAEFSRKRLWQRRLLYRCVKAVHTVSSGQREELIRAGLHHPRLTAILNGVNTDHFRPTASCEERRTIQARLGIDVSEDCQWIGIVARFGAYKRHADLIQAFESLASDHPKTRLLMLGDGGPEKERVLKMAQESPMASRIHWAGYQSDPAPWYQIMDLLVVPSLNEGLSNTTLEAMSCAVPVLSHDNCGAREMIRDHEGGWVRDLAGVEALKLALTETLPALPKTGPVVGRAGRERVSQHFSWTGMAEEYSVWLEACAGRRAFPA